MENSSRKYVGNLEIKEVYPKEDSSKTLSDLKTVGLRLSIDQVIELKALLETAIERSTEWKNLDISAKRKYKNVSISFYSPVLKSN